LGRCLFIPGKQALIAQSQGRKINQVSDHFGQGRVAVVTSKGFEKLAKGGIFVKEVVDIPNMLDHWWNDPGFIEFMDAVSD
jgi:hypothetical protein